MSLFYKMLLALVIVAAIVVGYDLFQAEIEQPRSSARIVYDVPAGPLRFEKPGLIRIVYASMFGPGEPVMRVRDRWITQFEIDYAERLRADPALVMGAEEKRRFAEAMGRRAEKVGAELRRRVERIDSAADATRKVELAGEAAKWLAGRGVVLTGGAPATPEALTALAAALEAAAAKPGAVAVVPRIKVNVERRWQGRWVLSANRPRFLSGMEVPDIIGGSKMELLALVQDHYVVALDEPLPGETVSPLDGPDTYGDPSRRWRDAFIESLLNEGMYNFLDDKSVHDKIYLPPTTVSTFCIFYNEVLFAKAGITQLPKTWPEFIALCEKLQAAGVTPLAADADAYCDMWQTWLTFRAVGPEAWERTIAGVPAGAPPQKRKGTPPWPDPKYQQVYAAIRQLRTSDYFDKDFLGMNWPAAQRDYAKGSAAMMICGSWLVQELSGYKDRASAEKFKLNCFTFPRWPGGRPQDQTATWASPYGLMICRQGKATRHAVELVKYLSAKDHHDMVYENAQISCMKDAGFAPALKGIEKDFKNATAVYSRAPNIYARRFNTQTIGPLYRRFFRVIDEGRADYMSVDDFLGELQQANEEYLEGGGEEGYE